MEQHETTGDNLLENLEDDLVRADTGKRFVNYLIDIVVFYILMFGVGILLAVVAPTTLEWLDGPGGGLLDRLISLIFYALFMGTQESILKGKSLGKLITGTRAVNLDGTTISTNTAFLRGLSRAVPFCAFSAFGTPCNPWQDRWTDTMVMDEKKSMQH